MPRFVQLRPLGHGDFPVEHAPLIDHKLHRPDVAFHNGFALEHDLLRCTDGASHFAADRDILRRDVAVYLAGDAHRKAFARRYFPGYLAVDANTPLTAYLSLEDRSRTDNVQLLNRICFESHWFPRS